MVIPGNTREVDPWIHLTRLIIVRKNTTELKKKADEMTQIPDKKS